MITTEKTPQVKDDTQKRDLVRRERRNYHKAWLESNNIKLTDFTVKMCWNRNGVMVLGLFEDEGNRQPNGTYCELSDTTHELTEPGKIYWIRPNPHFRTELEKSDSGKAYFLPVDELIVAYDPEKDKAIEKEIEELTKKHKVIEEGQDEHFNKMTIRDLAALLLRKPVSNKSWLNDVIKKNT